MVGAASSGLQNSSRIQKDCGIMTAFAQRFLPWTFFRATIARLTYCNSCKVGPVIGARDNIVKYTV